MCTEAVFMAMSVGHSGDLMTVATNNDGMHYNNMLQESMMDKKKCGKNLYIDMSFM